MVMMEGKGLNLSLGIEPTRTLNPKTIPIPHQNKPKGFEGNCGKKCKKDKEGEENEEEEKGGEPIG